jgi:hypothetical protein
MAETRHLAPPPSAHAGRSPLTPLATVALLAVVCVSAAAQSTQPQELKMKTVRLHIDGFMKSKSGAI